MSLIGQTGDTGKLVPNMGETQKLEPVDPLLLELHKSITEIGLLADTKTLFNSPQELSDMGGKFALHYTRMLNDRNELVAAVFSYSMGNVDWEGIGERSLYFDADDGDRMSEAFLSAALKTSEIVAVGGELDALKNVPLFSFIDFGTKRVATSSFGANFPVIIRGLPEDTGKRLQETLMAGPDASDVVRFIGGFQRTLMKAAAAVGLIPNLFTFTDKREALTRLKNEVSRHMSKR